MLKAAPGLRAVAVFEEMLRRHPELDEASAVPWNGASTPGAPSTAPSRKSSSARPTSPAAWDCRTFTDMGDLAVSIAGVPPRSPALPFPAGLLAASKHAHVILGGESFVALAEGLQNALWALGGARSIIAATACRPPSATSTPPRRTI